MHKNTRNALLGYGLATDLIEKIDANGQTLGLLQELNRKQLLNYYTTDEVDQIKERIGRKQIPQEIVTTVTSRAGGACCYCGDGNTSRPFQIHHVDPYSETQDNTEENLLVVCPTHHAAIHTNRINSTDQKIERRRWQAMVDIASDFTTKGLSFPFGTIQALDYRSDPKPIELVEFGPLSPSTALTCCPSELASEARGHLDASSFLLVLGTSGSGKSTYATALGGLYAKEGFLIYRYNNNKQNRDSLKQVSLFVSTCVRNAVIILDDANTWATATDLQQIGKLVLGHGHIRVIATWTSDDSDDECKLQSSDLRKQVLTWPDLRPTVIETILAHEGDIVEALQKFERDRSVGSLGLGSLHSRLEDRILALGKNPKTVYEFIFGLRGDGAAVADEFRQLVDEGRADVPVLHVAIEQIAGFERPSSVQETVEACRRVEVGGKFPLASSAWVEDVLHRQVRNKRLIRVRDRFTTIHRKWAAKLIAAGLISPIAKPTTELLLKADFEIETALPERLFRLWSWLESVDEAELYIIDWEKHLTLGDWTKLVRRCAQVGLKETGFIAKKMHQHSLGNAWTEKVAKAFEHNATAISHLVCNSSIADWYWMRNVSMAMEHACPNAWKHILINWCGRRGKTGLNEAD